MNEGRPLVAAVERCKDRWRAEDDRGLHLAKTKAKGTVQLAKSKRTQIKFTRWPVDTRSPARRRSNGSATTSPSLPLRWALVLVVRSIPVYTRRREYRVDRKMLGI